MKNLLFLFLLIFPLTMNAQLLEQGYLVNSRNVGNDLLLFVPDTAVGILRNPARAARYSGEFVYLSKLSRSYRFMTSVPDWNPVYYTANRGSVRPFWKPVLFSEQDTEYNSIQALTLAYLFGKSSGKWLIKIISYNNDNDSESFDHRTDEDNDSFTRNIMESRNDSKNRFNNVSITRTIRFDFADISLGISAGLNEISYRYNYDRDYNNDYSSSTNPRYYQDKYIDVRDDQLENQFAGANLGFLGQSWELTASLYYIVSDYQKKYERYDRYLRTYYDTNFVITDQVLDEEKQQNENQTNAHSYYGDIYFKKSLDLFGQHSDFFVAANGFQSFDDQKLLSNYRSINGEYNSSLDTLIVTSSAGSNTFGNFSQSYNLRSGFLINQEKSGLYFLTGLVGSFAYADGKSKSLNFVGNDFLIGKMKFKEYFYYLELPVYLSYSPANWIDLYGGYHLAYFFQDYTFSDKIDPFLRGRGEKTERENLANYEKTYLGINLKHASGFRAQIGFNGTLTSYRNWSFSLGYVF